MNYNKSTYQNINLGAKIFLRRGFVLKNNNRILIYTTKEESNSFNIIASIASTLDIICLSGFATFLWLQLHVRLFWNNI